MAIDRLSWIYTKSNHIEHLYSAYPQSALSALHGVPSRPSQPLCLSQLPGEHNREAVK